MKACSVIAGLSVLTPAFLAYSQPTYSVTDDKKQIAQVTVDPQLILNSGFAPASLGGHYVQVIMWYKTGTYSIHKCYLQGKVTTLPGTHVDAGDPTSPKFIQYATELAAAINSCSRYSGNPLQWEKIPSVWEVSASDGHRTGTTSEWGWYSDYLQIPPEVPKTCNTIVTSNINYGKISPTSSMITTYGSLKTSCDTDTNVSVSVNNNMNLENGDGSKISFDYVHSYHVEAGIEQTISIGATLETVPRIPGTYKWFAPVTVSYD